MDPYATPYRLTGSLLVALTPGANASFALNEFLPAEAPAPGWARLDPRAAPRGSTAELLPLSARWREEASAGAIRWVEPEVEYVVPVPPVRWEACGAGVEGDWHLDAIRAEAAWQRVGQPGAGVLIAQLDTGVVGAVVGPLFEPGRIRLTAPAWDLVANHAGAEDPLDDGFLRQPGHGTGTATLLAAQGEVPFGAGTRRYRGVAWAASVLPLRISRSVVHIATQRMAEGIAHAVQAGAEVITISMGGLPSQAWAEAVDHAYRQGVVVVAAAGNHFLWGGVRTPTRVVYPAAFERVIAVGGIRRDGTRYRFDENGSMSGNDGPELDLCAPTPCVPWVQATSLLSPGAGTSAATPQVAAAAAIWLSHHRAALPALGSPEAWRRVEAVRAALRGSANRAACQGYRPDWFGAGRLDVAAALDIPPRLDLPMAPEADLRARIAASEGVAPEALTPEAMLRGTQCLWDCFVAERG